ncbi:hypothetical protein [Desulfonatronospira sp.]|uniref:hypothetical protein n=1 Tax=Desulfonatronospira sp. TaxID=1962951 RepID=UPI0025BD0F33|nr:hypothetical protein [Desulfonatronospira sp.]
MWLKGILFSLTALLVLGFSMGCEPENEYMEEPGIPEGFEEQTPPEYGEPPEGYEQPGAEDPYGEPGEESVF